MSDKDLCLQGFIEMIRPYYVHGYAEPVEKNQSNPPPSFEEQNDDNCDGWKL